MGLYRKIVNYLGWIALIGMIGYVFLTWNHLPDQIPAHYNLQGEVDRYGGKLTVLLMPMMMSLIFFVLVVVEHFPKAWNIPVEVQEGAKERTYASMRAMLTTLRCVLILNACYSTYCIANARNLPALYLLIFLGFVFLPLIVDLIYVVKINKKERNME